MWEMRLAWFHTCYVLISLCLSSGCSMASRTWYVLICLSSGCSMASRTLGQTVELLLARELQLCFSSGIHAAQSSNTTSRWWHHTELPVKLTTSSLGLFRAGPSSSPLSALLFLVPLVGPGLGPVVSVVGWLLQACCSSAWSCATYDCAFFDRLVVYM